MTRFAGSAKAIAKTLVYGAYTAAIAPLQARRLARAGRQRISIVCYHRITGGLKDNVTISPEAFERQIRFLRRRYSIASVSDLVAGRIDRSLRAPTVIITFDDGYQDNYTEAAPILERHGLRGAFFVSTGHIGSDRGFAHDWEKLNRSIATMTWDQLRDLRARGHEIGAHTVNHVNLGRIEREEAMRELIQSRDTIRREIGVADIPFAYCFGGRADITAPMRALVRELGFTCCLGCYGGTNDGELDLFDVRRFGVNWAVTPAVLRAKIEGWA